MVNDDGYYMVNAGQTLLVGGWALPLWNMMEFVNGKDANPYMTWEKKHVPNHQPDYFNGGL